MDVEESNQWLCSWPDSDNLSENNDSTYYFDCIHLFLAFKQSIFPLQRAEK